MHSSSSNPVTDGIISLLGGKHMENEIMTTNTDLSPVAFSLEGSSAAIAIGYVVLGIAVLGVCAMFRGYKLDFGQLHIAPVA